MASGLLLLLDDIATLLDDVALLTKVATKKTAGVLGDDLALNAEQVSGVKADRELPVVWAVAKGSLLNKVILVPAALAISAVLPWLVLPLLMIGGLYLCYEGAEKVWHKLSRPRGDDAHHLAHLKAVADSTVDMVAFEKAKIKGAIRTDFILSAEIIVIALGAVAAQSFTMRALVIATVALVVTVGVYGLVAAIVKLDDLGSYLMRRGGRLALQYQCGRLLLLLSPKLMRLLSVLGTAAMFLVGGGIMVHGLGILHHLQEGILHAVAALPPLVRGTVDTLYSGAVGVLAGALVLGVIALVKRFRA